MASASVQVSGWKEVLGEGRFARFALLCLGVWLNAADALMTATIMPSVARDIGGYAYFGWAIAGYILGSIVAGASAGQFSLRFGIRRAMVIAALFYAIGCVVSAAAPEIASFLVGRLLQGIGAGWIVGLCYVAVGTMFPEHLLARVLAAVSGVWGIATLLSPLIGGVFAEAGIWRWSFWLFAIQGAGFAVASMSLLDRGGASVARDPLPLRQISVLTSGILSIAAAGLVTNISQAALLGVSGLFLLLLFVRLDGRARAPLLPRATGNPSSTAAAGYTMIFMLSAGTISFGVYGSAIMQALHGSSPLVAGYVIGAEAMAWTLAALAVSGLRDKWHSLFIVLGATSIVAGVVGLATFMPRGSLAEVVVCALFLGGGFGLCWAFVTRRLLGSVRVEERAVASSAVPTMQLIGGAAGSAGAGAIANFLGFAQGIDAATAASGSFWLFASFVPVVALGWFSAWRLARL
ncbi:MFS transporter [Parvibaculum sp.]|uniref:MFS transporter n=1 Tax=Parvibaculum sp. TaxID=2024848 RepID=UPI002B93F6B3|nr:MFS transporter [Parvibaculum sp.]HUD51658.1 MFS transporter [Parvibaculum sp.]